MRPMRHRLVVLHYIRLHNDMVASGDLSHLNKYTTKDKKKRKSVPYKCAVDKRKAAKAMKAMKKKALKAMRRK